MKLIDVSNVESMKILENRSRGESSATVESKMKSTIISSTIISSTIISSTIISNKRDPRSDQESQSPSLLSSNSRIFDEEDSEQYMIESSIDSYKAEKEESDREEYSEGEISEKNILDALEEDSQEDFSSGYESSYKNEKQNSPQNRSQNDRRRGEVVIGGEEEATDGEEEVADDVGEEEEEEEEEEVEDKTVNVENKRKSGDVREDFKDAEYQLQDRKKQEQQKEEDEEADDEEEEDDDGEEESVISYENFDKIFDKIIFTEKHIEISNEDNDKKHRNDQKDIEDHLELYVVDTKESQEGSQNQNQNQNKFDVKGAAKDDKNIQFVNSLEGKKLEFSTVLPMESISSNSMNIMVESSCNVLVGEMGTILISPLLQEKRDTLWSSKTDDDTFLDSDPESDPGSGLASPTFSICKSLSDDGEEDKIVKKNKKYEDDKNRESDKDNMKDKFGIQIFSSSSSSSEIGTLDKLISKESNVKPTEKEEEKQSLMIVEQEQTPLNIIATDRTEAAAVIVTASKFAVTVTEMTNTVSDAVPALTTNDITTTDITATATAGAVFVDPITIETREVKVSAFRAKLNAKREKNNSNNNNNNNNNSIHSADNNSNCESGISSYVHSPSDTCSETSSASISPRVCTYLHTYDSDL